VLEPGQGEGEGAAAVREADSEVRQPLQHAAKHQAGDGERRLQRVADDEREVPSIEPFLPDQRRGRVHEDRHAQVAARLEEGEQGGIVEVAPRRAGTDLHRAEPQGFPAVAQLRHGQGRVLQRHGGHAHEAPRVAGRHRCHVLVLHARERLARLGLGPVAEHHWGR